MSKESQGSAPAAPAAGATASDPPPPSDPASKRSEPGSGAPATGREELEFKREELRLKLAQEKALKDQELELKREELALKKQELDLQREQASTSRWTGPGAVAVFTGLLGILTLTISSCQNRAQEQVKSDEQQRIERQKQEGTLVLEAIRTGLTGEAGEKQTAANLLFLAENKLIQLDPAALDNLRKVRGPEFVAPALPARDMLDVGRSTFDDRVQIVDWSKPPYNAICRLVITTATGKQYGGTGVLVAPRVVLTTGHNVFMPNDGGWVRRIEVVTPFGSQASDDFRGVSGWTNGNPQSAAAQQSDYGAIILPNDVREATPAKLVAVPDQDLTQAAVAVVGYPMDRGDGRAQWSAPGQVIRVTPQTIHYRAFTTGGMGGGPVLLGEGDQARVVGIHAYGGATSKSAVRVTPEVLTQVQTWTSESQKPAPKVPPAKD